MGHFYFPSKLQDSFAFVYFNRNNGKGTNIINITHCRIILPEQLKRMELMVLNFVSSVAKMLEHDRRITMINISENPKIGTSTVRLSSMITSRSGGFEHIRCLT